MFGYYPQTPKVKGYGVGRLRHPFASRLEVADVPRESVVQGGLGDKQSPGIIFKSGYTFSNLSGTPTPFGSNLATPHGPVRSGVDPAARYSPYPRGGGGARKGYVVPGRENTERYWPPPAGGHGHPHGVVGVHGNNRMPFNYAAGNAAPGAMRAGLGNGMDVFHVQYEPQVHGAIQPDGENDGQDAMGETQAPATPETSLARRAASGLARGADVAKSVGTAAAAAAAGLKKKVSVTNVTSGALNLIRRGASALSPNVMRMETTLRRSAPIGTAAVPNSSVPEAEMGHAMSANPLEQQRIVHQDQARDPRTAQSVERMADELREGFAQNSPETNGLSRADAADADELMKDALHKPLPDEDEGASSSDNPIDEPTLRKAQVPTVTRPKETRPKETAAATAAKQARATMTTGGPAETAKTRERKPPARVSCFEVICFALVLKCCCVVGF